MVAHTMIQTPQPGIDHGRLLFDVLYTLYRPIRPSAAIGVGVISYIHRIRGSVLLNLDTSMKARDATGEAPVPVGVGFGSILRVVGCGRCGRC